MVAPLLHVFGNERYACARAALCVVGIMADVCCCVSHGLSHGACADDYEMGLAAVALLYDGCEGAVGVDEQLLRHILVVVYGVDKQQSAHWLRLKILEHLGRGIVA